MSIYNTLLAQYKNYSDEPPVPPTPGPDYTEHFYVEDVSGSDNMLSIRKTYSSSPTLTVETSTDRVNWSTMGTTSTTAAITTTIPANSKLYLRCSANTWGEHGYSDSNRINCSGNYNVGGNIMSLLYGSNFTGEETSLPTLSTSYDRTFECLFYKSTTLCSAEKLLLPATTLNDMSYMQMFEGCTFMVKGPVELPATTLGIKCYQSMYYECSSLATAPSILPATSLTQYCYQGMFQSCTSLATAPELPATSLTQYCYQGMFQNCKQLTKSPLLPATTLVSNCYHQMFYGCNILNTITCLATNTSASNCLALWVDYVSATGTFYRYPNAGWPTGTSGIPDGWTVVDYQG